MPFICFNENTISINNSAFDTKWDAMKKRNALHKKRNAHLNEPSFFHAETSVFLLENSMRCLSKRIQFFYEKPSVHLYHKGIILTKK